MSLKQYLYLKTMHKYKKGFAFQLFPFEGIRYSQGKEKF